MSSRPRSQHEWARVTPKSTSGWKRLLALQGLAQNSTRDSLPLLTRSARYSHAVPPPPSSPPDLPPVALISMGGAAVPSLLMGIGLLNLPESPRWLVTQGRDKEALEGLGRARGETEEGCREEFDEIKRGIVAEQVSCCLSFHPQSTPEWKQTQPASRQARTTQSQHLNGSRHNSLTRLGSELNERRSPLTHFAPMLTPSPVF